MIKSLVRVFACLTLIFVIIGSCKKKPTTPPAPEPNLVVTLTPPVNSVQAATPQVDFPLIVTINSAMPPQGVTITVTAKKDDGSGAAAFYTSPGTSSSNAINNFTITGTPTNVICLTTVTVTSKTKPANTWTGTYRYSRKP